ncbi:MAG: M1 family metallopeptidase [Proteobacteria bacterium]|nr:M1 family metallopeptidase [Pseudomonadota bacterium]
MRRTPRLLLKTLPLLCLFALAACGQKEEANPAASIRHPIAKKAETTQVANVDRKHDESSYAEPARVRMNHLMLDLTVDFDKKQLAGTATLDVNWYDDNASDLVLDTSDLNITRIDGGDGTGDWKPLTYTLSPADPVLGSKLTIHMPTPGKAGHMRQVRIAYSTSPQSSGLQWLSGAQTQSGQPFMFSQSEAIHARSWIPLQDTPGVRFSWSANIHVPKDTTAVMSADYGDPENLQTATTYQFTMPQMVPSYLLAIAVGDLKFKRISDRSGVWAEPQMVAKAAAEFADTEKMIETAEALYGPYRWGRYDILVLPPSFPIGGMENPKLTFATPTVIVGDKSLVSLVAHELSHSWSGNLVTNASWKDIWLNEGITTYVQGRITEALYGADVAEMERQIDQQELQAEIKDGDIKPAVQVLALPPVPPGTNPDDEMSDIAYTKGAWFMQFLEQRFGRAVFDPFLRSYFDNFAFQSVTTDDFEKYLRANLLPKNPKAVTDAELHAWIHEPGIPSFATPAHSARFDAVDAARKAWLGGGALPGTEVTGKWVTQEWVHFLEGMPDKLSADQMAALDKAYRFTGTPNDEIGQRWYPLAVASGYTQARPQMAQFLQSIGRQKLIMPTYAALAKTQEGLAFAKDVFAKAKPGYHPITVASVQALLDKAKPAN